MSAATTKINVYKVKRQEKEICIQVKLLYISLKQNRLKYNSDLEAISIKGKCLGQEEIMKTQLRKNKAVIKSATISPYPHLRMGTNLNGKGKKSSKSSFRKPQLALGEICSG